jgi:hypothetical protein
MFRRAQILGSLIGLVVGLAMVAGTAILLRLPMGPGY